MDAMDAMDIVDYRTAIELGTKFPVWFRDNLRMFTAVRDELIPEELDALDSQLDALDAQLDSRLDAQIGAREEERRTCAFGTAMRMAPMYPDIVRYFATRGDAEERAVCVQQRYFMHGDPSMRPSMQEVRVMEAALSMAHFYCFRIDKGKTMEEWLLDLEIET
jgi:hypothetical protein